MASSKTRLTKTRKAGFSGFLLYIGMTVSASASLLCEPRLHGDLAIEPGFLVINKDNNRFRIDSRGNLFFDVHKVALNDEQRASLTLYNKTIRTDLPFIRNSLSEELAQSWQALDDVIVSELGEKSRLRGELGQYHQHLQQQVKASFWSVDRTPLFNHQMLGDMVMELKASLPVFIAMISERGLQDVANLSEDPADKILFIANKMQTLQDKVSDEVIEQRRRTKELHHEVCSRFSEWESQETVISALIPALSEWKTVTLQ